MLGKKGKDRITGFVGTVTGHVRYITGCNQLLLAPQVDGDGKLRDSQWFDEQRIELSGEPLVLENDRASEPDREAPKR